MPANGKPKYKGRADFFYPGTNNVICDRTGFKLKATDCKMEWNGFFVWKEAYEDRNEQDFLRGIPERQQPDISRPGTGDVFLAEVSGPSMPVTANDPPSQLVSQNIVKPEDL